MGICVHVFAPQGLGAALLSSTDKVESKGMYTEEMAQLRKCLLASRRTSFASLAPT